MRSEGAHWLAEIEVDGCDSVRANGIANIAVDLSIVALQLSAPHLGTRNMSRLANRRGLRQIVTVEKLHGRFSGGWERVEPGLVIGENYLAKIISDSSLLIKAVGNCANSFVTGQYRLLKLEQAWCDSAYWLHRAIAEPIDTIAVAHLETAIEVLLRAENMSRSKARTVAALRAFFGVGPEDYILPNADITTRGFAKDLSSDRSQVLHGTWSTLQSRVSISRDIIELVVTSLVRSYAVELEAYAQEGAPRDDIEAFLRWSTDRRSA